MYNTTHSGRSVVSLVVLHELLGLAGRHTLNVTHLQHTTVSMLLRHLYATAVLTRCIMGLAHQR